MTGGLAFKLFLFVYLLFLKADPPAGGLIASFSPLSYLTLNF